MSGIKCVYYVTERGEAPVVDFVNSLHPRTQQKFFACVARLEVFGRRLPEPHMKHLQDGIFELRFAGIEGQIRILHFFFKDKRAVLTNGFVKKQMKAPKREIEKAIHRRVIYLNRKG